MIKDTKDLMLTQDIIEEIRQLTIIDSYGVKEILSRHAPRLDAGLKLLEIAEKYRFLDFNMRGTCIAKPDSSDKWIAILESIANPFDTLPEAITFIGEKI